MSAVSPAADEDQRTHRLDFLELPGPSADEAFDRITQLAARVLRVAVALITVAGRTGPRLLSCVGTKEIPLLRELLMRASALQEGGPRVVADLRQQERFADLPFLEGPSLRAYAGVPLRSTQGPVLGTLCVLDREPRTFSAEEMGLLEEFAALASHEIQQREAVVLAHRRAEATRLESEARFQALSASSPLGMFQTDEQGHITFVNARSQEIWGVAEAGGLLDSAWLTHVHPQDLPVLLPRWKAAVEGQEVLDMEFRLRLADGAVRHVRACSAPLRDERGVVLGRVGMCMDITESRALREELSHHARHDTLTRLENRACFRERVAQVLAGVEAGAAMAQHAAVLFVDLDEFKTVNDSLGHEVGDRLLTLVAARLLEAAQGAEAVARLGGDEFAVLLSEVARVEDAARVAERIVAALAAPFHLERRMIRLGASVGIAMARAGATTDELLRNADLAMYQAKNGGKGRYAIFAPQMHANVLDRLTLEDELHHAIDGRQFLLKYQPIVELASGHIVGAEALVRWQHPERGMIAPNVFIPIAEQTGLIVPMGRWIMAEACREAASWQPQPDMGEGPAQTPISLSVNVSACQLQDPLFVGDVRDALCASGLVPGRLVLEITESVLMHDREATLQRMHELKALGVRFAVDDFGTGFSSLAYLQQFPIDVLKIDKAFVDTITAGGKEEALVRTIIGLADALGMRTVAEGVEEVAQKFQLQTLGCRLGQGYLFASPMAPEALSVSLRTKADVALAQTEEVGADAGEC